MPAMAHQKRTSPVPEHGHTQSARAVPEPAVALRDGLLPSSAIVSLQRYLGNSGVQRLLDSQVQRKKVLDEDVQITGSLSVSNDVYSEKDLFARGRVSTGGDVHAKGLWTSGGAAVDGDLVVRGNTRKG